MSTVVVSKKKEKQKSSSSSEEEDEEEEEDKPPPPKRVREDRKPKSYSGERREGDDRRSGSDRRVPDNESNQSSGRRMDSSGRRSHERHMKYGLKEVKYEKHLVFSSLTCCFHPYLCIWMVGLSNKKTYIHIGLSLITFSLTR